MPLRLRPRFEAVAPCGPDEAARRLRAALARPGAGFRGGVYGAHALVHVPAAEERVWSPFLSLDIYGRPGETRVRGLFGPKPSVWTLFVAAYGVCACVAFFAGGFGWAQWGLGQTPWALAGLPAAAAGALVVFGLAQYGRRRGQAQMAALRAFLDGALGTDGGAADGK